MAASASLITSLASSSVSGDGNNIWTLLGSNGLGSLVQDNDVGFQFSGFNILQGGSGEDTYLISSRLNELTIKGGMGNDVFKFVINSDLKRKDYSVKLLFSTIFDNFPYLLEQKYFK